ncbi:MAG: hypothetical protein VKL20_07220 [Synechocystis sp.]|nr:hypothetical protein [Synechocystis sp.]
MQQTISQLYRKVLLPLCLSGWMVSCSPLNPFGWAQGYLDIAQLDEIANQRAVNLQGIVVNVAPFLEGGAYQIQDKTGKVWVRTDGALPKKGEIVTVKGEVAFEAIFIGPEKLGESYVIEMTTPRPTETATSTETDASTATAVADQSSPTDNSQVTSTPKPTPETLTPETPTPETTAIEAVDTNSETARSGVIEVVDVEVNEGDVKDPTSGAAALMPSSDPIPPAPQSTNLPIANPTAPRPIAKPPSTEPPSKPRLNLDDQFLPHKRLAK